MLSGLIDMRKQKRSWQENSVPILIDPKGVSIGALKRCVVIDAILAKRNLGTRRDMAPAHD